MGWICGRERQDITMWLDTVPEDYVLLTTGSWEDPEYSERESQDVTLKCCYELDKERNFDPEKIKEVDELYFEFDWGGVVTKESYVSDLVEPNIRISINPWALEIFERYQEDLPETPERVGSLEKLFIPYPCLDVAVYFVPRGVTESLRNYTISYVNQLIAKEQQDAITNRLDGDVGLTKKK